MVKAKSIKTLSPATDYSIYLMFSSTEFVTLSLIGILYLKTKNVSPLLLKNYIAKKFKIISHHSLGININEEDGVQDNHCRLQMEVPRPTRFEHLRFH